MIGGGTTTGFRRRTAIRWREVNWEDAQEYVSWLSRRTAATYRLPTEAEWERAAAGTPAGVGCGGRDLDEGTCPVGSYGANAAGLSDMVGKLVGVDVGLLGGRLRLACVSRRLLVLRRAPPAWRAQLGLHFPSSGTSASVFAFRGRWINAWVERQSIPQAGALGPRAPRPWAAPRGRRPPGGCRASFAALLRFDLLPQGFRNRNLRETVAALCGLSPDDYGAGRMTGSGRAAGEGPEEET